MRRSLLPTAGSTGCGTAGDVGLAIDASVLSDVGDRHDEKFRHTHAEKMSTVNHVVLDHELPRGFATVGQRVQSSLLLIVWHQ